MQQDRNLTHAVLGIMSGTSLDGVDLALCEFTFAEKWNYKIIAAETVPYDNFRKEKLERLKESSALELWKAHAELGEYFGTLAKKFSEKHSAKPDLISSHGHTVFHQPGNGITCQIGDGSRICAITGTDVVYDFRSLDVAMGGQGAPLVPAGDKLLFSEFDFCLNLGGIANVSFDVKDIRIAYDICPVNMVLNYLSRRREMEYDKDGNIAKSGTPNPELLNQLNQLNFYKLPPPKSLGAEWVEENIFPLMNSAGESTENLMRTFCEHIAVQVSNKINGSGKEESSLFITGGGAHNKFLISLIQSRLDSVNVVLPAKEIIDFKEAMVFAFLGLLRKLGEVNVLASVTGAGKDHCAGVMVRKT